VVQSYVGFEDAVRKTLETKIANLGLQDKILEIYIPTHTVTKTNNKGEKVEKEEKLHPGYIYVKAVLDKEIGYLIQNTNYVSRIAGTGDVAVPLEEDHVAQIKESLLKEQEEAPQSQISQFQVGELVQVTEGPFQDMQGKITAIEPKEGKLDVVLTMFDRDTVVNLDVWEVKKAL
jgi:transcriptional antiterminator NusG